MEFEEDGHLAPRWFCDSCSKERSSSESVEKSEEPLEN